MSEDTVYNGKKLKPVSITTGPERTPYEEAFQEKDNSQEEEQIILGTQIEKNISNQPEQKNDRETQALDVIWNRVNT